MDKRGVVIEQLFEDFPNDVFNSGPKPQKEEKAKVKSAKEDNKATKRIAESSSYSTGSSDAFQSKSLNDFSNHNDKAASSTTSKSASRKSSGLVNSDDHVASSKPITPKGDKRVTIPTSPQDKGPFSSATAISLFREKLTSYELAEIQNVPTVYYLGIGAKKMRSANRSSSSSELSSFDDEENFYRVVPRDHILFRYEVAEKPSLGKGTFGEVIKAFDHKEKRTVAIKVVRNERIYLKQSREELRILQALRKQDPSNDNNVIHIYDFFMFRNHMCFVFELVGMNLFQVLKRNHYRGLGGTKILLIARSVLKCLELLFKNRIIHCDIKPENIMLRRNGDFTSVKVGDFGSSCYEHQQIYHYIQSRYYRAPEVILGMRYGPAIDMWSFGCVLGELSNGYPLFVGSDEDDQLAAIEEVLGNLPPQLTTKSASKRGSVSGSRGSRARPGTKSLYSTLHGDDQFKDFVAKTLEWDPAVRPTPGDIQEHRWLKISSRTPLPSASHPGTLSRTSSKTGGSANRTSVAMI